MRLKLATTFAILIFSRIVFAGDVKTVAVFASEKIMGKQVRSFFSSVGKGEMQLNECENAIGEKLREGNFTVPIEPVGDEKTRIARRLAIVFGRYSNIGMMPNDTATQAAYTLDDNSAAAVVCSVVASDGKKNRHGSVCAEAECKAVDVKEKKRVAAIAFEKCLRGVSGLSGGVAAIREACLEMGDILARKLEERYSNGN